MKNLCIGAALLLAPGLAAAQWTVGGAGIIYYNGHAGIGTTNPLFPLHVRTSNSLRAITADNTAAAGATYGLYAQSASPAGRAVFGLATATTGTTNGVGGRAASSAGRGVFGLATSTTGLTYGVLGQAASSGGRGVLGWASSATGATIGVQGQAASSAGKGVFGLASAVSGETRGVHGRAASPLGNGVFGEATASTGIAYGVHGQTRSTAGTGVFGEAAATTGATYGVQGHSHSNEGFGVFGIATADTGATQGVRGQSDSTQGYGVLGLTRSLTGPTVGVWGNSDSAAGKGILGSASSATGATYGVYGIAGSADGFGVYSNGNMGASGTKPFRIDHPEDPAGKYLFHYAAESPEVINFYRGTVTLDPAGAAEVALPAYFARINRDPSYTLTPVGGPMPLLHVAQEIDDAALIAGAAAQPGDDTPACTFRIAGGAPGGKVCWRVEAVRNDAWTRTHAAPVEAEKTGQERGRYQHPDLYGQPPSLGLIRYPQPTTLDGP